MSDVSAQEALNRLKEGNAAYMADNDCVVVTDARRKELVSGQDPFAIILSCADSRVVPEAVFNTGAGELFVLRVAGNIANTSTIASIEYAVAHLGTKLIMVLGHESCGAVTAALGGGDNGYNLNHLCAHIVPAIDASNSKDVNIVVKKNAQMNAQALADRSKIISDALSNKGLEIVSGYYNLGTGKVDILD